MNTTARHPTAFKLTDFNTAAGTFAGYASTWGNEDLTGDIVERGAFAKTLRDAAARKAATGGPYLYSLLWMHDANTPIGGITLAREDAKGLAIEGQIDLNIDQGKAAFSGLKSGYINSFSIGYDTIKSTRDTKGIRHLVEVKLWEVSLITAGFSANELALADPLSVKSAAGGDPRLERMVDAMANDMKDWRAGRLPLGAPKPVERAPDGGVGEPKMPTPEDYASERAYREAWDEWLATRNMRGQPTQAERDATAFNQAVAAAQAARLANGTASVSERLEAYAQSGKTPDGRQLPDVTEAVRRGYEAVYDRIDEESR